MLQSTLLLYKNAYSGLSNSVWWLSLLVLVNRIGTMVVLFLTVYFRSRKREDIDYKTDVRLEIASDINQMSEQDDNSEITDDYYSEHFLNAKEKLEQVIEDLIYQITMRNLSMNTDDIVQE